MVATPYVPEVGDLVWVDFDPQAGREQSGRRPALVLSAALYNRKTGLAVFCPVTSQVKNYPFEVILPRGMKIRGAIMADHLKSQDWTVRAVSFAEKAPADVLFAVRSRVAALLNLRVL